MTTAIGLFVAIPAVWMFNYLTGRVEAFDVEMDNSSSELIDYFLKRRGMRRASPSPSCMPQSANWRRAKPRVAGLAPGHEPAPRFENRSAEHRAQLGRTGKRRPGDVSLWR